MICLLSRSHVNEVKELIGESVGSYKRFPAVKKANGMTGRSDLSSRMPTLVAIGI